MAGYGYVDDILHKKTNTDVTKWMTIGLVVDTNDPQQMGRVRAFCPGFGDSTEFRIEQIPWAMYVSPLGGMTNTGSRGVDQSPSSGPVAYGMWNIPKVGAQVLVGLIDGDASLRFYAGCIHPQYMTHTMPHGRFTWHDQSNGTPDGPLDTLEEPIQPLYDNLAQHFTKQGDNHPSGTPTDPHRNMEWRTRGVDDQTSAITNLHVEHDIDGPGSEVADHEFGDFGFTTVPEEDGSQREIKGPGYGVDQLEPDDTYPSTGGTNYDSQIYSWTTPGFHSISMDDRHENSRIRIRTTSGHQIIMDDTNERIYISTAGGESWIEIDQVGNIDIYASKDISTHAGGDINFVADKAFRVQAKEGIHLSSEDEIRIGSSGEMNIRSGKLRVQSTGEAHLKSGSNMFLESSSNADFKVGSALTISTGSGTDIKTGGTAKWESGGSMHHKSGGTQFFTASKIELNGPPADSASSADSAENAYYAFIASRVPEHEPWARIYSDPTSADKNASANTFVAKPSSYTDTNVGRQDRDGNDLGRNPLWHR